MILVRTDHPCLRVGFHKITQGVSMDDRTRVILSSILRFLHQDMARNHDVVRAYLGQRRRVNRLVQRALRATVTVHNAPATVLTQGPTLQPATGPSHRPMELSPPHPAFSSPVVRSDDLNWFYGRTVGVTPLPASGGAGTSQERALAPPHGSAIIDFNILATSLPSPTPATMNLNPNGSQLRSPPPNPNPNGSPPCLFPLGNRIIHRVIWLPSSSTRSRPATTPWRVVNGRPFDSTVRRVRFN
jgi:hypothetical protein